MLRYTKFNFFPRFVLLQIYNVFGICRFGAKIVNTMTWRMTFLTWTKPGDNLEFYD